MNSSSALRTGLVGCGFHGTNLAEALTRVKGVDFVACADPDEAALRRATSRAAGLTTFPSLEALLAGTEVDTVVLATPHHLLAPLAVAALRAGKHVMAEKPIGLDEAEAIEVGKAAAEAGICFMSGYSFRFSMFRHLKSLLDQGVVGEVSAITGSIACGPMDDGWRAEPKTGGGPLLYVGSHLIDMVLWFLQAMPQTVSALVESRPGTGAEDVAAFQLRFEGGVLAQCLVTQASPGFAYDLTVHGREGWMRLRGYNFLQFEIEVFSKAVHAYAEPTVIRPFSGRDNIDMMLVPELEEFARAAREHRSPSITVEDGRRVLQVTDAIRESGRTGQPIHVG